MKFWLFAVSAMVLCGCVQAPIPIKRYAASTLIPTADVDGYYNFGSTRYKGPLINGAPDGTGICIDTKSSTSAGYPCTYSQGNRIDTGYLLARSEEIEEARQYELERKRETEASWADYQANQRAESAARDREAEQALVAGLVALQKTNSQVQAAEQENKRNIARLREVPEESQAKYKPAPQLESETLPVRSSSLSSSPASPDLVKPLNTPERKTYPFNKTVTYQSSYANLSKDKALETVKTEQEKWEAAHMGFTQSWQAVSTSQPDCAIREDIRESGHWLCKVTVQYKGVSYMSQEAAAPSSGNVQER